MIQLGMTGIPDLKRQYAQFGKRVDKAILRATNTQAALTITKAKKYAPVDTGRMRASGRAGKAKPVGTGFTVVLGFYTNYAIYVHEDMTARHPVGGAKFLERAINEDADEYRKRIVREIGRL